MKVIFLDMDGVLCTIRSHIGQDQRGLMERLDREAVGLLNRLAEAPGADVRYVLSSTWRTIHDRDWMTEHLRGFGWRGEFHEDWRTIALNSGFRGDEIAEWLGRHPEIEGYLILDDESDFRPEQAPYFVHTHIYDGLSWQNFQDACAILHGSPDAWFRIPAAGAFA